MTEEKAKKNTLKKQLSSKTGTALAMKQIYGHLNIEFIRLITYRA